MNKIVGNGTVYYNRNKKSWIAEYYVVENGKQKRKSISSKNKDDVYKKLNKIMYDYHNDNYIRKNGITLLEVLNQNREDKYAANLISDSHYSRLEFVLKEIESSSIGNMNIDQITTRDLQTYFNSLINRYSDSTIKKVWECTKQGFQAAYKQKYILENPFEDLIKPKSKKETKVLEAMTTEDEEKLSSYLLQSNLSQEKYKVVILTQLYTGMRIGEVLALASDDIDFDKNIIRVRKTITVDRDGELIIKSGTKTYSGKRDIPISPFLYNPLVEQIHASERNPNNLLFTYEGRLIKASTVNTVLKRICKQLGLSKNISNHTLRHTFGTRCIESGMAPKVVQTLMGHKDISVTLNTYTSVLNQYKEEEFGKLAQYYINKNMNRLPGAISPDDNLVHSNTNDYIPDLEDNIYNAYVFNRDNIISLFESEENYKKELNEAWTIMKKWREKQEIK